MKNSDKRQRRYITSYILLFIITFVAVVLCTCSGSIDISYADVWGVITGSNSDNTIYRIIWDIRLPRVCAALILGGALSVSGFLLQTFFGNPIAGPFVLGISSGAKLAVAIAMITLLSNNIAISSFGMILAAFAGSMISMSFVLIASKRIRSMSTLIVCGVMVGYICSAITDFMVAFADDTNIVNLHNWSMGSFSGISWSHVRTITILVFPAIFFAFMLSKPMSAYQLGESYAKNMGVNIRVFRISLILLSSVLSACVAAFAGPISFVGIAVPQLVRLIFGTSKPIIIIPAAFISGGLFCLVCDGIARSLFAPVELSVSSVTALFGAPVVICMMLKKGGGGAI